MHFDRKCLCLPKSEAEGGEAERGGEQTRRMRDGGRAAMTTNDPHPSGFPPPFLLFLLVL